MALFVLTGMGPLVAWRRASLRSLLRGLSWPAAAALAAGAALVAVGAGTRPAGLPRAPSRPCVLASIVVEFVRGTRARRSMGRWLLARRVLVARRTQSAPLRRATSCTRRSRCSRSASPTWSISPRQPVEHRVHPGEQLDKSTLLVALHGDPHPGAESATELRAVPAVTAPQEAGEPVAHLQTASTPRVQRQRGIAMQTKLASRGGHVRDRRLVRRGRLGRREGDRQPAPYIYCGSPRSCSC